MKINKTNKLKTNTSGFGHIETLLIVVAVVVIAGVGFFVYQNHNKKTTKAHAAGWTQISYWSDKSHDDIYGCWNGQWGNYSEAKIAYVKQASANPANRWYHTFAFNNTAMRSYSDAGQANAYWAGTIAVQKVAFNINNNVDVYYGDGPVDNEKHYHTSVKDIKAYWNRC